MPDYSTKKLCFFETGTEQPTLFFYLHFLMFFFIKTDDFRSAGMGSRKGLKAFDLRLKKIKKYKAAE